MISSDIQISEPHEAAHDLLARAKEALSNNNYSDAQALSLQALRSSEILNQPLIQASAHLILAEALTMQPNYIDALEHLHQVLDFAESVGDRERTRHSLSLLGKIAYKKKNFPLALEYLQKVIALCDECSDEFSYRAHHISGIIFFSHEIDKQKAIESHRRALLCAQALNSAYKIAQSLGSLGIMSYHKGDLKEAVSMLRQVESVGRTHGFSDIETIALQNLATVYSALGDNEQALLIHHRLIEHYEGVGDQILLCYEYYNLARVCFSLNNLERSKLLCERVIEILSTTDEDDLRSLARLTLAEIHLKEQHYEIAVSLSRDVVSDYEERGSKTHISNAYGVLGRSLYQFGEVQNAIVYLKKSADFNLHNGSPAYAESCIDLAGLFLEEADLDTALSYYERARSIAEQQNINLHLPKIYLGLSKVYDAKGDLRNAYDFYRKYHESSEVILNLEVEKTTQQISIQYDLRQIEAEAQREREKNEILSKANQELQEANRLKNEFLSIAAHDLKNPLQSILGFAEMIQEPSTSLATAQSHAEIISRSASHMVDLVKSLLETAVISSNALTFEFEKVSLCQLLQKIITDFQPTLQAKSQTISLHSTPDAFALVDIDKMHEVFSNLISNAIKYSPTGTEIKVQVALSHQGMVLVSVRDEGQGLNESDKQKLFGRFQRLSSRPTGGESSTGLGLWIAKAFVEKHSGKIWAESEGKGRGTTFFVELPAVT